MLPLQFFGQNLHFVISLFAALVFFAVFWLYFDAWLARRQRKEIFEWAGFLLLALSFVVSSTQIEQSVLGHSFLGSWSTTLSVTLAVIAFACIVTGHLLVPLQKKPTVSGLREEEFVPKVPAVDAPKSRKATASKIQVQALASAGLAHAAQFLPPVGALVVAGLYWRRATTGLERHLRPIAIAFGFIFGYELLALGSLWRDSTNPSIAKFVAAFGPLWITEHVLLLIGVLILGNWVQHYLTRRFMSQLFMTFTSVTLAIFLLTTVSFTFLLAHNVQNAALNNLGTAANVLNYAISNQKAETLANTEAIAENPAIVSALSAHDHAALMTATTNFLREKKQSSLIITSDTGQVFLRAEDPSNYGDSLSSDTLLQRALIGQSSSSVTKQDGVLAPVLSIRSATPIRDAQQQIIGAAVGSVMVDNAFVDGIKNATGLDSSVYAGNVLSATTFVAPDGVSRWVGAKDTHQVITQTVLKAGHTYRGSLNVLNQQYLAVYAPLKDVDNTVIGMLFIGQPQVSILQTAGDSIQLTFLVTVVLLMLTIVPAYLIARYITRQV